MDFKNKRLNQKVFSKKAVRAESKLRSRAYREIMQDKVTAHVIDKAAEKRVFYDALRKRGLASGKGITKKVMKQVLGDIEHSGEFSHKEMHTLGEHLIGGPASGRIIREHKPQPSHESKETAKPRVDMRKIIDEIRSKSPYGSKAVSGSEGNTSSASSNVSKSRINTSFGVSDKNIRAAEERKIFKSFEPRRESMENNSQAFGHIPKTLRNFNDHADISEVRSMLAKIQDKADNYDEDDEDLKQAV
ncbi:MAG TPA: hypothetical protein VF817_03960 [Patescibacteria group bacterium]